MTAIAPRLDPNPAQPKKWTIMLYSAADNNLKEAMLDDVRECETVGSDSYTNLLAQVDQGDSEGASRYLLQKSAPSGKISTEPVQHLGDTNMADPKALADFVKWGVQNYPAEHYMLIISDHGNGWRGCVEDDSANGWMTIGNVREGLDEAQAATGKKLDIVGFDACLMASTEVADELKDNADFLITSEQTEGADGWGYSKILNPDMLKRLRQFHIMKVNVEPRELAVLGVKSAQGKQDVLPTMSAIDTSKVPALVDAADKLGSALAASSTSPQVLADIANNTQDFTGYKDAWDLADRLSQNDQVADSAVKDASAGFKQAIQDAVIAEEHSQDYPGAHGITIEASTYGVPDGYADTKFGKETHWPDALGKLGAQG